MEGVLMVPKSKPDSDELLDLAASGDRDAIHQLFVRHRPRLRQMVSARLNLHLARRVDPSDIVQESLADAAQKLSEYLETRPIPFYPWLRQFAWERLVRAYRRHVLAQRRSVHREQNLDILLSDQSATVLADRFLASDTNPLERLARSERRLAITKLMAQLPFEDRELVVLRFIEQLSPAEVGAVLGISEAAAKMRQLRVVRRLRAAMGEEP
jgi:RNA polymerase sigma-70 factor (ECF subfamily)